jgi:hypothetical protein
VYADSLFLPGHAARPPPPPPPVAGEGEEGAGEAATAAAAAEAAAAAAAAAQQQARERTNALQSTWTEDKFLRSVSGMRHGRPGQTRKEANAVPEAQTQAALAAAEALVAAGGAEASGLRRVKFEDGGARAQRPGQPPVMELD